MKNKPIISILFVVNFAIGYYLGRPSKAELRSQYERGSHVTALNYNPETKKEIALADLFTDQPDYLKTISDYCIKNLTKQIIAELKSTNGTWIKDGAGPVTENFKFFLITKDNLTFYFPKYQVAYGAAGDFKVTMPR